ncbi:MAG: methyltransferase domain-containing protein [Chromatiales bacterium]|nr:methyltransferase domain-containing protein [Chromatiales bacterium]
MPNVPPCPVCQGGGARCFFSQHQVPVQCGYLAPTRDAALHSPLGDITLHHCPGCGHVWNSSFDPDRMGFDPAYDFSQYHSPSYRAYVEGAIQRLIRRYDLGGKTALDIACGKGDFLRLLVAGGMARAIGFDPTFVDSSLTAADRERITVHRKFYDSSERSLHPALVTCRSALQYIPDPRTFLLGVREALADDPQTILCFEVPNGAEPFLERVVWYVMYEAGCFFSAASLARLFRDCGFQVLDVLPALGGSHLEIEARPAASPTPSPEESGARLSRLADEVEAFPAEYTRQVEKWSRRFGEFDQRRQSVALWGGGMRAVSLLVNVPAAAAAVQHVVDVNPARQGRYLPKTGQRVISPAELADLRPDVVIATNPHYAAEIREQVAALGLAPEFDVLG